MRKLLSLGLPFALVTALAACGPSAGSGGDDTIMMPGKDGGTTMNGADASVMVPCTGADCPIVCPAGKSTKISGQIFVPKGDVPVPFARAYVPRSKSEFPTTVSCEVCSSPQDPAYISTISDVSGRFTLDGVPLRPNMTQVEIAIQKGRFRKYVTVDVTPCEMNDLTTKPATAKLTLPKNKTEGSLPKIAVATGDWDAMECVLGQNGFGLANDAFDRFDNLSKSGTGQNILGQPVPLTFTGGTQGTKGDIATLIRNLAVLKTYNIIFLNCSGTEFLKAFAADATMKSNLEMYVKGGGRLYVTDWSYDWIEQVPEFAKYITFEGETAGSTTPETLEMAKTGADFCRNQSSVDCPNNFVNGQVVQTKLLMWLSAIEQVLGAMGSIVNPLPDQVKIKHWLVAWVPMKDFIRDATNGVKLWVQDSGNKSGLQNRPLTVTFDYNKCGRILYSSYHTLGRPEPTPTGTTTFAWQEWPSYCSGMPLAAQERILEYLILEVSDCITIN